MTNEQKQWASEQAWYSHATLWFDRVWVVSYITKHSDGSTLLCSTDDHAWLTAWDGLQ